MNKKTIAIYISIIIVVGTLLFRPSVARGECAGTIYKIYDALVDSAQTIRNPEDAKNFLARMYDILFNREITQCDENGNPISVPLSGPDITEGPTPTVDPNAPTPGPINGDLNAKAYSCASQISPHLQLCKMWNYGGYCRLVDTVNCNGIDSTNRTGLTDPTRYWCTNLVKDAVSMAYGQPQSTFNLSESVVGQTSNWKAKGWPYYSYFYGNHEDVLKKVKPGCAMFMMSEYEVHNGHEHVAVLKSVDLDQYGNGTVRTLDANGPVKESQYQVHNWDFVPVSYLYPQISYGCL